MENDTLRDLQLSHHRLQAAVVVLSLVVAGFIWNLYHRKELTVDHLTVGNLWIDDPDNPGWQKLPNGGATRSPLIHLGVTQDGRPRIAIGREKKYLELGIGSNLDLKNIDILTVDDLLSSSDYLYLSFLDYTLSTEDQEILKIAPQMKR